MLPQQRHHNNTQAQRVASALRSHRASARAWRLAASIADRSPADSTPPSPSLTTTTRELLESLAAQFAERHRSSARRADAPRVAPRRDAAGSLVVLLEDCAAVAAFFAALDATASLHTVRNALRHAGRLELRVAQPYGSGHAGVALALADVEQLQADHVAYAALQAALERDDWRTAFAPGTR